MDIHERHRKLLLQVRELEARVSEQEIINRLSAKDKKVIGFLRKLAGSKSKYASEAQDLLGT